MKIRNFIAAAGAVMLLILFLPIYYYVVFCGNEINYNAEHKIVTLYGNEMLLVAGIIGILVVVLLYRLLRKIPYTRRSIIGWSVFLILFCVLFYLMKVEISKSIAFYGGWDCGMVANSARWVYEGADLGYDDYYTIYSNNIPVTWLLYKLYGISSGLSGYAYNPEFIWIQFQCLQFALAVFCVAMTALLVCRTIAASALALLLSAVFLGLSPWNIIPYTDGCTIAIPIFVVFVYTVFSRIKSKFRYGLYGFLVFAGVLGGIMKATSYVALIAILLVDIMWRILKKESIKNKLMALGIRGLLIISGFAIASLCKTGMYQELNYQYNYDMEMTWVNYMYNGLNELTTGACSPDGLSIVRAYAGYPREVREAVEIQYIKDRIKEKGMLGLLDFWKRKQVMNYNDGTFTWYQEGFFNAWEYENITESKWKEPLRNFYWEDRENYAWFTTISQGVWLFVLLGVIMEAAAILIYALKNLVKKGNEVVEADDLGSRLITIIVFVGAFLFVLLFEGRARYLYNNIPVFILAAAVGCSKLSEGLRACWRRIC